MKIAQIMLAKGFGGAERSFVDISHALSERGHEVVAICEARGKTRGMLSAVRVIPITVRGHWDPLAQYKLKKILLAENPQIVHAHLARAAKLAGKVSALLNIPSLVKTHNYVDLKYYQHVSCLVPTTNDQEQYLLANGVRSERICRVPNFTAMNLLDTAPVFKPQEVVQFVAIGRFVQKKGFDLLIRALASVARETAVALTLVGDGELHAALQAQVNTAGLQGRVTFHGWSNDVAAILDKADIFVLPSRDEPFGIVCLEAMARGVPIVATNTQGPSEILSADTAFLVEKNSSAALAAGMKEAIDGPQETTRRAKNALALCRENYTKAVVVNRYLDIYQRLLGASS